MTSDTSVTAMVNGVWMQEISVKDRGLAYGDGLFETCKWTAGRLPLWTWHQSRLIEDALRLFITIDEQELNAQRETFCDGLRAQGLLTGGIKLIVTRGQGGVGYTPLSASQANLFWQYLPILTDQALAVNGVRLVPAQLPLPSNARLAGIKHLNRLDYVLAAAAQPVLPGEQLLMLDEQGCPVEALQQNLFWCRDGVLYTPSVALAGVNGVLRRVILECLAPKLGLARVVDRFPFEHLLQADEVFVCNSLRGIWPVNQLATRSWSNWPLTSQLQILEQALWHSA